MALSPELAAIKDAMDKQTGDGRDHAGAVTLAEAYVTENPDLFAPLRDLPIEDLVKSVDVLRAAGLEEEHWRVEAYLLAKFNPQSIGGEYHPTVRLPGI